LGYRSNPYSGGQGVYLKYVSRALHAMGHEVHVISGEPYPDLAPGVRLIKLPGLNLYATPSPLRALRPRYLRSATDFFEWASIASGGFPEPYTFGRRVAKYMAEHHGEYDIIHDNQSLSYGVLRLQQRGHAVVTTIHHPITYDRDIAVAHASDWGMRLLIKRWHHFLAMQTKVACQLKHITTVSDSSKQDICRAFNVDPARVEVVHNGVDAEVFCPRPGVQRDRHHLITTASADQPLKGTQHLIPAFAKLREEFDDLHLTFIGQPKPGGDTEKLIKQYALNDAIEFKHGISAQEIVELYARATIAVVPSEYEGFGLPAAEAMACAVPVVSTDGGALPEVVGDAGMIVAKGSPQALATGIADLLRDADKRLALGCAGRARMQARFNWENVAAELTDYYHRIIEQ
jgi:glycosyltransferase involved in cell wall biosynthesis